MRMCLSSPPSGVTPPSSHNVPSKHQGWRGVELRKDAQRGEALAQVWSSAQHMVPKALYALSAHVLPNHAHHPIIEEMLGQFHGSSWLDIEKLVKTADPRASKARRRTKLHRLMRELKAWVMHLDTHWDLNDSQEHIEYEFRTHCPTWNGVLSASRSS